MAEGSFEETKRYEDAVASIFKTDADSHSSKTKQMTDMLRSVDLEVGIWFVEEKVGKLTDLDAYIDEISYVNRENSEGTLGELRDVIASIFARADFLPGRALAAVLRDSRKDSVAPIEWADPTDEVGENITPHWPTGCDAIDAITGGGYGMTIFGGMPKVGKSLLAISSAVCASRAGFSTVYCNAEMSPGHILERFHNYMRVPDKAVAENLHIAHVGPGITIDKLYAEIKEHAITDQTEKILIVLDSINRIVDFGCSAEGNEDGYWRGLADWSAWAMNSRRATEGRISWAIVSELNSQGLIKGRNLEYTADCVVRMSSTGADDIVDIDIPYSRATRAASVGAAYRDWSVGKFIVHE